MKDFSDESRKAYAELMKRFNEGAKLKDPQEIIFFHLDIQEYLKKLMENAYAQGQQWLQETNQN